MPLATPTASIPSTSCTRTAGSVRPYSPATAAPKQRRVLRLNRIITPSFAAVPRAPRPGTLSRPLAHRHAVIARAHQAACVSAVVRAPTSFFHSAAAASASATRRRRSTAMASKTFQSAEGRPFNFSAGPATLPIPVLEQARDEMLSVRGSGISVNEISHRSKVFEAILNEAEGDLRALLSVPANYKILFMQGGASTQFACLPLNLTQPGDTVDYVVTGAWSKKAYEEAARFGVTANLAAKGDGKSLPPVSEWKITTGAKYLHYCDNETIGGVEFHTPPEVPEGVTLVADMSSDFLSKPVDVSKYGLIYAGAQKNVGPSGVVIVIVREDLLGKARAECPTMLDYKTAADNGSMYNTPPCWPIYMCGLVFKYLREKAGGIDGVAANNAKKAKIVYDAIAASNGFYCSPVAENARSRMNVPFTIPSDAELEKKFVSEATAAGLKELKGHRSVGGMRASIYNAMPIAGVEALAEFMAAFQKENQK